MKCDRNCQTFIRIPKLSVIVIISNQLYSVKTFSFISINTTTVWLLKKECLHLSDNRKFQIQLAMNVY